MYTADMARKDFGKNENIQQALREQMKIIEDSIKKHTMNGNTSMFINIKKCFPSIPNLPIVICKELKNEGFNVVFFDDEMLICW